eukprot:g5454.t1
MANLPKSDFELCEHIILYLNELSRRSECKDIAEELDVSSQCLQGCLERAASSSADSQTKKSGKMISLTDIFNAGKRSLESNDDNNRDLTMYEDPRFKKFVSKISAKGFFKDHAVGSAEYEILLKKAHVKFVSRFHRRNDASGEKKNVLGPEDKSTEKFTLVNDPEFKEFLKNRKKARIGGGDAAAEKETKDSGKTTRNLLDDPRFQKFVSKISDKGFFKGQKEGTEAHDTLLKRAHEQYVGHFQAKADALKNEGNQLMKSKNYQGALASYVKAIEKCGSGPTSYQYFGNSAAARLALKDYAGAEADCRKGLSLKPDYGKLYKRLGTAQEMQGNDDGAAKSYERAIALDVDAKTAASCRASIDRIQRRRGSSTATTATTTAPPPPFPNFGGGMPPGGMAGIMEMMKNPEMMRAAQNMMKDPAFMGMAQNMMANMGRGSGAGGSEG